jgi:hypothetical protein
MRQVKTVHPKCHVLGYCQEQHAKGNVEDIDDSQDRNKHRERERKEYRREGIYSLYNESGVVRLGVKSLKSPSRNVAASD